MKFRLSRKLSEHIERFDIFGSEPPRFGGTVASCRYGARNTARYVAVMLVEHARFVEASLPLRFLAKRINRERSVQPLQQVGSAFRRDIVHHPSH